MHTHQTKKQDGCSSKEQPFFSGKTAKGARGLLNDDGYAFVPRKLVEKELSNELLFEIEIVDEQIPPMNNYVIYKSTSPKRKLIQQWLNEVAAD